MTRIIFQWSRLAPARRATTSSSCASCSLSALSQPLLRQFERANQRFRLVLRFLVLSRRIRIGDDAGAGLNCRARARNDQRANRDAEIQVSSEVEVADGTGI